MSIAIPRTKICGVTQRQDLDVLAAAGTECVGLNFVASSKRSVSVADGRRLSEHARQLGLKTAAVVMDLPYADLSRLIEVVPFDFLQLHGAEEPELVQELPVQLPIIKAISWSGRDWEQALAEAWRDAPNLAAFLVDAYAPGVGGGTGKTVAWDLLWPRPTQLASHPLILAGGLSASNVAEAIAIAKPHGVDTASGVETAPGIKDHMQVHAFVRNATAALSTC